MNRAGMQRVVVFLLVALLTLGLIARISCPQRGGGKPTRPARPPPGGQEEPGAGSDDNLVATGKGVGPAKDPGWVAARRALLAAIERARRGRVAEAAHPHAGSSGAPSAPDAPDDAGPVSELDKDYIKTQVHEIHGLLGECYEQAMNEKPALEKGGQLTVSFDIEAEPEAGGLLTNSEIVSGSFKDEPAIADCVRETMYAVRFARPISGGTVHVTYPFIFKNDDDEPDGG